MGPKVPGGVFSMNFTVVQTIPNSKNENLSCDRYFLEYSWKIPYSKIIYFRWCTYFLNIPGDIPYFKKFQCFPVGSFLWNITYSSFKKLNLACKM